MVKNDGTPFWAHVTAILETEADHTELRIIFYDMTKRKEVEIALQEEKRRYQLLADYAKECIFLMDASGNYIYISPACETTSGYKSEEFLADRFLMTNIIHPDDREMYQHHLDHLHENDIKEMELRIVGRDGSEHWIAHYCDTVRDENGLYLGRRGSNRDITERKEREFGLKMFRTLLDHSSDSIEVVDPLTMRFLMINDTACRRLGYSREELLSTAILTETIHPPSKR
jgi:PAS domain S-box-containing protein